MSFLKPSVFVKLFLIFFAISAVILLNSCKQLASFDPGVDGARVVADKTFSAPTGVTATQGRKQKITLEWVPVSGARYYDIYCARSATAEFEKIGETTKNSFDDKVGAGSTRYYKVCAVKSNNTQSAFSATVKGTSLAQPVISGGNVDDSSATISWFMENARSMNGENNYEDQLSFEVFCERGGEIKSTTLSASNLNSDYKWTFEGLAGSTNYQFYVRAYNVCDQQSYEESAKVNNATLTSYMPLAPKFNVSEGESAKGIWLYITLPEKVMVNTVTKNSPNEKVDEPYPLYFKIYRRVAEGGGDFTENDFVSDLYYNGSTEPPSSADYSDSNNSDSNKGYKAGDTIEWFDSEGLQGGVKYEYMIRSYPDKNYDAVVCPENTVGTGTCGAGNNGTTLEKATKAVGWKSAHPSFRLKIGENGGRTFKKDANENNTEVLSYEFGFSADWNDLGKADKYEFAIKQNRKPWDAKDSDNGTDTWLENGSDGNFFGTLAEVNAHKVKFGSENSGLSADDEGLYSYALYIVSKDIDKIENVAGETEDKVLCRVDAIDKMLVTKSVNLPKPKFTVKDGYTTKVDLIVSNLEPNVKYEVTRKTILKNGISPSNSEEKVITLLETGDNITDTTFTYYDTKNSGNGVDGNCRYSYILKATDKNDGYSLSESQEAETLGTPEVDFKRAALSYDSVTITFDGVLAAKEYTVTLGASDGFGGGEKFEITKDDSGEWKSDSVPSSGASAKVEFSANKFTVTINKPYGYNDAELAGNAADLTVTAHSKVDNALSVAKPVNVLGPALLNAQVNTFDKAKEDSISLTWNKVADAKGYLIRRVMYSDIEMKDVAGSSDVTYYYEVSSGNITANGDDPDGRATVDASDSGFKLTDTYMEITTNDDTLKEYQEKQSKIAWGLPFKYVVLPVLKKDDFYFKDDDLALESGKVTYANLAEKQTDGTATFGYGLKVHAKKSESVTEQNVTWEKPFYGEKLTPKVYRRKFADRNKNEWGVVDALVKNDATNNINYINYSPSGNERYCAWEYVVKYVPNANANTIAPSYLDWLNKSEHEETDYDYGNEKKEQLNKGYLLAMEYSANYGGEGTSKNEANYYSEDVKITPWDYADRVLAPDKVELKVLSLDLASGWQLVGALDPEIESFIKEETLDDTTVEYTKTNKLVKLKPTTISNNKNGTGTTDGPLKILRSAKHYYGLSLPRGGNEHFDCKNYEEYACRQITDEEIVKSTMLVVASMLEKAHAQDSNTGGSDSYNGYNGNPGSGEFKWSHNYQSRYEWLFSSFLYGYDTLPCGEDIYKNALEYYYDTKVFKNFFRLTDSTSLALRGRKYSQSWKYLCVNPSATAGFINANGFDSSKKIAINIVFDMPDEYKSLKSYDSTTVNFAVDIENHKFYANCNGTNFEETSSDEKLRTWFPVSSSAGDKVGGSTTFHCKDFAYGWWDN